MSQSETNTTPTTTHRTARTVREYLTYMAVAVPAALLCAVIVYFMNAGMDNIGWGSLPHPMSPGGAVRLAFLFYAVFSAFQRYWVATLVFLMLAPILGGLASQLF